MNMKVYEVLHTEIGEYIGHGLTNDTIVTISIHATEESAKAEAKRLKEENGGEYWVYSEELFVDNDMNLKCQEVEPIQRYWRPNGGSVYECGACKAEIGHYMESLFCKRCGRKVKWVQ